MVKEIKTIKTNEYPTRYVAFKNPTYFVENANPQNRGGYEFAVYYEPYQNQEYPHLTDGIYIEISSYQGKKILLDCHLTIPNKNRQQKGFTKLYNSYKEAKQEAFKWLEEAHKFLQEV